MPQKAYQCGACYEIHDFHHLAESCCQPDIDEVWLCDVCTTAHDSKQEAVECCVNSVKARGQEPVRCPCCLRDQEMVQHAVEIEVAGHCSECNPHFTVDESFAIADLVDERVAENLERTR